MKITSTDKVPRAAIRFIEAMNRADAITAAACFTGDASVDDQFGHYVGRVAIQQWMLAAFRDFKPTLLPLRRITSPVDASLAVSLSGRFPGSPVQVDFHFTFARRRIARLTIDG